MEIKIIIDEITLDTVVGDIVSFDEDGDAVVHKGQVTVADKVAEVIAKTVMKKPEYATLRERVTQIRTEEIRARVAPVIEQALQAPIQRTNSYGSPLGEPITLTELIMEAAREAWQPERNSYSSSNTNSIDKMIATEVRKQISGEVTKAVRSAQEAALKAVGEIAGAPMVDAVRKVLKG